MRQERVTVTCLENRIAVFSPHTCYDALDGGVNDWLCEAFGKLLGYLPHLVLLSLTSVLNDR